MSRPRSREQIPRPEGSMPCDGTVQDYRRHSHYGEDACPESREAWRKAHLFYTYTNLYVDRDDAKTVHPFFYRKAKRQHRRRNAKP